MYIHAMDTSRNSSYQIEILPNHSWWRHFVTVFRLTIMDLGQRPIVALLMYSSTLLVVLMPFIPFLTLGEENRLVRDANLSVVLMFGVALAVYCSAICLYRDLRDGVAELILSKPVSRLSFLAAKYISVAAVILIYLAAAGSAYLVSSRASRGLIRVDWHLELALLSAVGLAVLMSAVDALLRRRRILPQMLRWISLLMILAVIWAAVYRAPYQISSEFSFRYLSLALLGVALALINISIVTVTLSIRLGLPIVAAVTIIFMMLGFWPDTGPITIGQLALSAAVPRWTNFWLLPTARPDSAYLGQLVAADAAFTLAYGSAVFIVGWVLFRNQEIVRKPE